MSQCMIAPIKPLFGLIRSYVRCCPLVPVPSVSPHTAPLLAPDAFLHQCH